MDTDNSGTITFEELKAGLAKQGANLVESEVRQLMEAVSVSPFLLHSFFSLSFAQSQTLLIQKVNFW
jgi:Ca2+-binding EF-hand superfamily protein